MSLDDAGKLGGGTDALSGPPRLPFWRTVIQAYALWARNLPDLVRACWLWMVLVAPFLAVAAWLRAPHMAAVMRASRSGQPFPDDQTPLLTIAALFLSLIVMLPAAASIAVAWHRLVLRGEHPGSNIYLRLDTIVGGYMALLLAIWCRAASLGCLCSAGGLQFGWSWRCRSLYCSLCRDYHWCCLRRR